MTHIIECARDQQQVSMYYVNLGTNLPVQGDARLYAPGLFQLATVGNTLATAGSSNNLGEFWVSYEIEFRKPRILPGMISDPLGAGLFDHFNFAQLNPNFITITPLRPFGTSPTNMIAPTSTSSLRGAVSPAAVTPAFQNTGYVNNKYDQGYAPFPIFDALGNPINSLPDTYYFPKSVSSGTFLVMYNATYTAFVSGATIPPLITQYSNCFLNTTLTGLNTMGVTQASGSAPVICCITITVSAPNAYFTFKPVTTLSAGTCTAASLSVSEIPLNII